jgi:3'-phosphoadenosine 5'-phosphosulfate sulfotransferase (PAPS reductase)/FAD synthetase
MKRHIVGLSGGKDSTAMALRLAEVEPRPYEFICNETGNELPEMRAHWRKLEELLQAPITPVRHVKDLIGACREEHLLPNVFRRWCTRILKIEPTIAFFKELDADSVLYVGLRADEESRRGLYGEDVQVDFPMRRWGWGESDVWGYLDKRGVSIPDRTDCGLCPYQRLGEWRTLYFQNRAAYDEGVALEKEFGATIRSPGRDTWPASLDLLGAEFERGRPLREYRRATTCRVCSL